MDEELVEIITEQDVEVVDSEIIETEVTVEESEQNVAAEVATEAIEVEPTEEIVIEMEEAVGWTGGDSASHYSLTGRSEPDQHPISAITGLRTELDEIERLKTVYSDKIGVANFYKWNNGSYDEFGYFVSMVPHTSEITICDGADIFGVTVDGTMVGGFVGGQDEDAHRDNTYALVTTSGIVDVRCELDVEEGSYVVSNAYGIATKTDSGCGYKVIAIEEKNGVTYAVIVLGVQACTTDVMGQQIQHLDERMDDAETNIVSAINVANKAYSKALEVVSSNQLISDKVDDAIDVVDKVTSDIDDLESQVSNSALISEQARAIAESAATSAESMRNEAIEKANEALDDTAELRKELEATAIEMDTDLENTALELEAVKENLESTKNSLQGNIDDAVSDFEELAKDLEPLATWPNAENPTGVAGFVARANEDSATLASIVTWKGDAGDSLAGFVQEATDNHAVVSAIASYKRKDANGNVIEPGGAAGLTAQVDANQSELNAVASYEKDGAKGLAGLRAQVDANKSELSAVVSYENGDASGLAGLVAQVDANKSELSTVASYSKDGKAGLAGLAAYVDEHEASVSNLAEYEQKDEDGNVLSTGTAGLIAQVEANKSSIELLSKFEGENSDSLAGLIAETEANSAAVKVLAKRVDGNDKAIAGIRIDTDENSSSIDNLTSWQGETNISMARIEQKADANGAYIQSTVSNMDKYSVGPHSQAYGFTLEQAVSVLEEGMIYVPANESPTNMNPFTEKYKLASEAIPWVDGDKDINKVYYTSTTAEDGTVTKTYWHYDYDDGDFKWLDSGEIPTITRSFTPTYLYKWGKFRGTGPYRWITVDKDYTDTDMTNTSAPAVRFQPNDAPTISNNDTYGYWYTNGDTLTGTAVGYAPYTLYKWDLPYKYQAKDENGEVKNVEEYHWVAVATLAGNSSNRAVSQIRQDANSIEAAVTGLNGEYAGIKTDLSGTQATVQQLSKYANNGATIKTEANEAGSAVTIQSYTEDDDGTITEQASLVLNVINDPDGSPTSALSIDADYINFNGFTTFVRPDDLGENGATIISGDRITTGVINANNYSYTSGVFSDSGMGIDLDNGVLRSMNFTIDKNGNAWLKGDFSALGATIGGWEITTDRIWHYYETDETNGTGTGAVLYSPNIGTENNVFAIGTFADSGETWDNAEFRVTGDGVLHATGADISGVINATSGYIGGENGWIITQEYIASASKSIYLFGGEDGTAIEDSPIVTNYGSEITNLVFRVGQKTKALFGVGADGKLYASDAYISGQINASSGSIADFDIDAEGLVATSSEYNDEFGIEHKNTTTVRPNSVSVEYATTEYSEPILIQKTNLSAGLITVSVDGREVPAGKASFMYVNRGDTKYLLYIDTTDLTVKVEEISV